MVEVVDDDRRTVVVNAYDVVEAISVPVVVFSPFIEEIEVLVRAVGASVLMVEVLNGSIVSDTDVTEDEKSVGVILTWVVSVVMASCVIDSAVDSVSDTLVMGSVVMIVEISAALDVVSALTIRVRTYGNNNSRYDILYLQNGIVETLFVTCGNIYIYLYRF